VNVADIIKGITEGLKLSAKDLNASTVKMAQRSEDRLTNHAKSLARMNELLNRKTCTDSQRTKLLRNIAETERKVAEERQFHRDVILRLQSDAAEALRKSEEAARAQANPG